MTDRIIHTTFISRAPSKESTFMNSNPANSSGYNGGHEIYGLLSYIFKPFPMAKFLAAEIYATESGVTPTPYWAVQHNISAVEARQSRMTKRK
jgi:hypothetical protein